MSKRASSQSSAAAATPQKRPKIESGQPGLASFFKSPASATPAPKSSGSTSKSAAKAKSNVISLLSDDEEEVPVASTSKVQQDVKPEVDRKPALQVLGANSAADVARLDSMTYPIELDLFQFDPPQHIDTSAWPRDGKGDLVIPYSFLSSAFAKISATKSRLEITNLMANALRTIICFQPDALLPAIYLITNHVAPAYEGVELGVGSQVLSASLKSVSGTSAAKLKQLWNKHGDPGDVAFEAKSSVRTLVPTAPLTITAVHSTFLTIASLKGQGVTAKKSALVNKMLVAARGEETRFVVRSLCANLRIGAVRLTVTSALARAFCMHQGVVAASASTLAVPLAECSGLRAVAKTSKQGKDDPKRRALMARMAQAEAIVRKVYVRHPNYEDIVASLLDAKVGLERLEEAVPLQVGTPLSNMLGQITRSLEDVQQRFSESTEFAAEFKYDGQRAQVHARRRAEGEQIQHSSEPVQGKKGQWVGPDKDLYVRVFSRHLEDMTDKYPDILQVIYRMFERSKSNGQPLDSIIVDAEVVAVDGPTGKLLDFQTLTTRARKDVAIGDITVRAKVFAFDLMYLNGEPLLAKTFRERRNLLHSYLPPYEDLNDPTLARFGHVESMIGTPGDLGPVEEFFKKATGSRCEGIMVKILDNEVLVKSEAEAVKEEPDVEPGQATIDAPLQTEEDVKPVVKTPGKSPIKKSVGGKKSRKMLLPASYEPDKRADAWLKVKKDYAETGGDSLDLVPIAVWHGQGRKAGWWSPILLGVYDPSTDSFSAVCKCISGFSDQFYKDLNERYPPGSDMCFRKRPANVNPGIQPDWYLKPSEVWEIRGADISLSPVYPAAKGLLPGDRGLSLRFPRFMKLRDDKSIEQATTPHEFVAAYHRQQANGQNAGGEGAASKVGKRVESGSDVEEYASEEELVDEL